MPGDSPRRPRPRSLVLQVLATAAILGLVALTVSGLIPGSGGRLRHAAVRWIAIGVGLELCACAAYAWLFHGVFSEREYRVGRRRAAQIGLGELAGYVITPTGAGGPALRIWALMQGGMPFRIVMIRTVIHGLILQTPYVVAAMGLGLGAGLGIGAGRADTLLALAPIGLVIVALVALGVATRLARRSTGSQGRWRRVGRDIIQAIPSGARQTPRRVRGKPGLLIAATAYWAGDCGVLVAAFAAAHGSAPVGVIVLAYMLGQLGNALPLPGGVGGVEPAMLGVLTSSGVDAGLGGAAVVLYRFVSLGLQSALGATAAGTLLPALRLGSRE